MKRERKHGDDEYQIWSGRSNPKQRGMYIVYWKGIELQRCRYFSDAQAWAAQHKRMKDNEYTPKPKPLTPETDAWLDRLL